jgi:hypothetical protein
VFHQPAAFGKGENGDTDNCMYRKDQPPFKLLKTSLRKVFRPWESEKSASPKRPQNILLIGTPKSEAIAGRLNEKELAGLGNDCFIIRRFKTDGTILVAPAQMLVFV